jgi:uncharacterized protein (DUF302 family)
MPMVIKRSAFTYEQTAKRLVDAIERRGVTIFASIDHAAGARGVGLELADEQVVIFGNPQGGTPLMQSDPRIGIELPLRMLLWREADGVLAGYEDPRELSGSFHVGEHQATLEQMAGLLEQLADEATS